VALLERLGVGWDADFYLCGPTAFLQDFTAGLANWGVARDRLVNEYCTLPAPVATRSAWGSPADSSPPPRLRFAPRDSDCDVRFLYVHRRNCYFSVQDGATSSNSRSPTISTLEAGNCARRPRFKNPRDDRLFRQPRNKNHAAV
jgi:hypothetical protein